MDQHQTALHRRIAARGLLHGLRIGRTDRRGLRCGVPGAIRLRGSKSKEAGMKPTHETADTSRLAHPSALETKLDPSFGTAGQAIDALRRRVISSRELTAHVFDRIKKYNPKLNLFV